MGKGSTNRVPFKAVARPNQAILHGIQLAIEKFKAEEGSAVEIRQNWRRGNLTYKLRPVQMLMYRSIQAATSLKYVVNSSRRLGKSYLACLIAIEEALKGPNRVIRLGAPTQKAMRNITRPLIRDIIQDAPMDLRPVWDGMDGCYRFKHNGSECHVSGCNAGHAENLRGNLAHRIILDESGSIDDLKYVVNDILLPQLLTTGGRLLMCSTPPRTPAHDFTEMAQAAQASGNYSEFDIHQSGYEPSLIRMFQDEAGGENSTTWKREYLCQFVVDENYAVIPEWSDSYIQEAPRDRFFEFYHKYNMMDLGVRDFNVNLLGYYDFKRATLYIEDEIVMSGPTMTTAKVAEENKKAEERLWGPKASAYVRVADSDNPLMLQDMGALHGIVFRPTTKDNLEAMVNHLRLLVAAGRIRVSPRCKHLIGCLKFGVWMENRKEFDRSSVYGHFDGLAALIYGARALDQITNPIPPNIDVSESTHFIPDPKKSPEMVQLKKILGRRR